MEIKEILRHCDHTILSPSAVWADVKRICDEGMEYGVASVCIPSAFVARAKEYTHGALPICTVIGFPNGYSTTAAKCFEASDAIRNGADEVDMVISIGALKAGEDSLVEEEIRAVKAAVGDRILKVIIETCLLTEKEKIRASGIVTRAGADFIKTSTGFSTGGATREDVALLRTHVGPEVKVKAAGGISTLADAVDFLALGADRLGSSRLVALAREAGARS